MNVIIKTREIPGEGFIAEVDRVKSQGIAALRPFYFLELPKIKAFGPTREIAFWRLAGLLQQGGHTVANLHELDRQKISVRERMNRIIFGKNYPAWFLIGVFDACLCAFVFGKIGDVLPGYGIFIGIIGYTAMMMAIYRDRKF